MEFEVRSGDALGVLPEESLSCTCLLALKCERAIGSSIRREGLPYYPSALIYLDYINFEVAIFPRGNLIEFLEMKFPLSFYANAVS